MNWKEVTYPNIVYFSFDNKCNFYNLIIIADYENLIIIIKAACVSIFMDEKLKFKIAYTNVYAKFKYLND